MNNIVKQVLPAIVLAIIAFFFTPASLSANVAIALGLIIGAIIAAIFSSSAPASTVASADSAPSQNNQEDFEGETKTLYVGNLPYRANESAVKELFSGQGHVVSVRLMRDRNTGKRKGFGFVEMAEQDAIKAISALNDAEFQQRTLKVREAKDRPAPVQAEPITE